MMDDSKRNTDFELISAYIDGEVNDEERARIESDPELMNEVNQALSISKRVGEVLPNDPETRENHIKTALNEMPATLSDSVTPIKSANNRRLYFARPSRILGAVAAAILIVIAIPLFRSGESSTTQIASETIEESGTEQVAESDSSETEEQSSEATDQAESALFDSSPTESTLDFEEAVESSEVINPEGDTESGISMELEDSQSKTLPNAEPSDTALQALTTPEEAVTWGPVNTYTNDDPNVYNYYLLHDVRIESGESFDSFIIEFVATSEDPLSMLPGPYAIEINGEFLMEEDSYVLPTEISEYIVINVAARGGVWSDETGYEPSWGSFSQTITADESNLTGVYFGDFEANLTFILGMEPNSIFRSYQTMDPPQLIIEVDHNS
tara:strand:+ start:524 stop:1675 length:1152 start_codon:yes stop_codon:yes gene_type:complete